MKISDLKIGTMALAAFSGHVANAQNQHKQPNIVLLYADDLGYTQTSLNGYKFYATPNIEALANKGITFTQAYAPAAVCSPSRASLFTGKYPARLHLTEYIKGDSFPDKPLMHPNWTKVLKLEEVTLAEQLKKVGYSTALFGKWHLAPSYTGPDADAFGPMAQGFDTAVVLNKPNHTADPYSDPHNTFSTSKLAIDYITANKEKPFFVALTFNTVHNPLIARREARLASGSYGDTSLHQNDPVLGAMVRELDSAVGLVVQKLEQLGLSNNTIVIFHSDNGGNHREASCTPLREGKSWLYQGGIKVPLSITYPAKLKPNQKQNYPIISTDLMPTLLAWAGVNKADYQNLDGTDLSNVMVEGSQPNQRSLFWHYPHYHRELKAKPSSAMLFNNYKIIENFEEKFAGKPEYELYNITTDPYEKNNLAISEPKLLKKMAKQLTEWQKSVDAQLPSVNPNYKAK